MKKRPAGNKGKIILATVKGDIHDIGKNIVALLLRNYGYHVIDLGKDVAAETIIASKKAKLRCDRPFRIDDHNDGKYERCDNTGAGKRNSKAIYDWRRGSYRSLRKFYRGVFCQRWRGSR